MTDDARRQITQFYNAALDESAALLPALRALAPTVCEIARRFTSAWDRGNKIFFAGNGGSAADAMHFSEELVVRYARDRRPLASLALLDPTAVTCAGNDMGFDQIFSRQIDALGKPGDVFVGITTSGNSPNILRALDSCKKAGIETIGFLGKDGGKAANLCDVALVVPSNNTARVQEAHKLIFHSLCDYIDAWAS